MEFWGETPEPQNCLQEKGSRGVKLVEEGRKRVEELGGRRGQLLLGKFVGVIKTLGSN